MAAAAWAAEQQGLSVALTVPFPRGAAELVSIVSGSLAHTRALQVECFEQQCDGQLEEWLSTQREQIAE